MKPVNKALNGACDISFLENITAEELAVDLTCNADKGN